MIKKGLNLIGKVLLIVLVVSPYILEPMVVNAQSADTLRELRDELSALESKKNETSGNVAATQDQINKQNQEIADAYANIEKSNNDIALAEQKIAESEVEIDKLQEDASALMVMFEQLNNNEVYLEYVTGASSMTDLIMRTDAINQLLEYNKNTIDTLENLILENEQATLDLIEHKDTLSKNIVEYEKKISSLSVDLASFTEISEDIDDQIKNQRSLIEYYENLGCKEDQSLTECVAVANNVSWLKPFDYGVVTSIYGYRYLWGRLDFHNAVDIGGNWEGTPIYSITNGTVSAVTYRSGCGGTKVYVHSYVNGQAYTVSYLHLLQHNVNVGDKVTTNTVIGTVGGGSQTWWDSCSTGAHLHLGVATGFYLGGGPDGYSSYSTYVARAIEPPGYPGLYGAFYSRTQWFD